MKSFLQYIKESFDAKSNLINDIDNIRLYVTEYCNNIFGNDNLRHSIIKKNLIDNEIDLLYQCKNNNNIIESIGINFNIDNDLLIKSPLITFYDADMYVLKEIKMKEDYKEYEKFLKDLEKNLPKAEKVLNKEGEIK